MMFIQTEATPNPQTLKFLPGSAVSAEPYEFVSAQEAEISPLAVALFELDGVRTVFLGSDYIALTKTDIADWNSIKPQILAIISDYFATGVPVLLSADRPPAAPEEHNYEGEAAEIVEEIKTLLASRVRPAVAMDGGDISFHAFDVATGLVLLRMRGACAGCPSAEFTLKSGVENLLRHYIPEVTAVEAVQD